MEDQDPLSTSGIHLILDSDEEEKVEVIAVESDYDVLDVGESSSSGEEEDCYMPLQPQDFMLYVDSSSDEDEIDTLMDIENNSLPQVFASPLPPVASPPLYQEAGPSWVPQIPSPLRDLTSSPPPVVQPSHRVSSPPSDPEDWDTPLITRVLQDEPLWTRVYPPEPPIDIRPKFSCRPGPRHTRGCKTPADYIQLFLTTAVIDSIVTATNAYAARTIESMKALGKLLPQSRMNSWVDVTRSEIWKYLSMLLAMGLIPKNNYTGYWSNPSWQHKFIPFFSETMSLRRFELISSCFQVVQSPRNPPLKGEPNYDPWVKIRGFYDAMNNKFKRHFVPHQEIRIDESMIVTKGSNTFIRYTTNKQYSRRGILKYDLCDSISGYTLMSLLCPGKGFLGDSPDPFTEKVVKKLLTSTRLLKKGYHLFTDNFYTKTRLANFLRKNNTYLTGTINRKSSLLSKKVKSAVLQPKQSVYFRSGKLLLVKYKGRKTGKPVHVISTAVHAEDLPVVSKSGLRVKPVLIDQYNHFMGGVGCKDKSIYYLTCSRTTKKYWKKIVYNFIDMAVFNAYVLFVKDRNKKMPLERFIDEIVKYFCYNDANPVSQIGGSGSAPVREALPNHRLEALPGTNSRKCIVCSKKGSHKWCPGCNKGVHLRCYPLLKHFTGVTHNT